MMNGDCFIEKIEIPKRAFGNLYYGITEAIVFFS